MQHHGVVADEETGAPTLARVSAASLRSPTSVELTIPPELALVGFQSQIALSFFYTKFTWGHFWRPLLPLNDDPAEGLHSARYNCGLAIAYGYMGVTHRDQALTRQGLELYGRALADVRTSLGGQNNKQALVRLTPNVITLGMYAYAVDEDFRFHHHPGVAQIMHYCGPESFQREPMLTIFRSCRALLVCKAFATQKRTFLEEEAWMIIPWARSPKTDEDVLFDILAPLPGIAERVAKKHEESVGFGLTESATVFTARLRTLLARLEDWRWAWERVNANCARIASRAETLGLLGDGHGQSIPFSHSLEPIKFDTISQARCILMYNAAMCYILRLLQILEETQRSESDRQSGFETARGHASEPSAPLKTGSPLLLPGEARAVREAAVEAVRSIPFFLKQLALEQESVMVSLAPTGIVYCALASQPDLEESLKEFLERMDCFRGPRAEIQVYDIFSPVR